MVPSSLRPDGISTTGVFPNGECCKVSNKLDLHMALYRAQSLGNIWPLILDNMLRMARV
jgi:hypothetical protein